MPDDDREQLPRPADAFEIDGDTAQIVTADLALADSYTSTGLTSLDDGS